MCTCKCWLSYYSIGNIFMDVYKCICILYITGDWTIMFFYIQPNLTVNFLYCNYGRFFFIENFAGGSILFQPRKTHKLADWYSNCCEFSSNCERNKNWCVECVVINEIQINCVYTRLHVIALSFFFILCKKSFISIDRAELDRLIDS